MPATAAPALQTEGCATASMWPPGGTARRSCCWVLASTRGQRWTSGPSVSAEGSLPGSKPGGRAAAFPAPISSSLHGLQSCAAPPLTPAVLPGRRLPAGGAGDATPAVPRGERPGPAVPHPQVLWPPQRAADGVAAPPPCVSHSICAAPVAQHRAATPAGSSSQVPGC